MYGLLSGPGTPPSPVADAAAASSWSSSSSPLPSSTAVSSAAAIYVCLSCWLLVPAVGSRRRRPAAPRRRGRGVSSSSRWSVGPGGQASSPPCNLPPARLQHPSFRLPRLPFATPSSDQSINNHRTHALTLSPIKPSIIRPPLLPAPTCYHRHSFIDSLMMDPHAVDPCLHHPPSCCRRGEEEDEGRSGGGDRVCGALGLSASSSYRSGSSSVPRRPPSLPTLMVCCLHGEVAVVCPEPLVLRAHVEQPLRQAGVQALVRHRPVDLLGLAHHQHLPGL